MSIEVLLINQVEGLGIEGDVVTVAAGYARNYLFPKGYASKVTEGRKRQIERKRVARLVQLEKEKSAAEEIAGKLKEIECVIAVKVSKTGKMFGSVGVPQILEKLTERGLEIGREKICMEAPLHELGVFDVSIRFHSEVTGILKVRIVAEK